MTSHDDRFVIVFNGEIYNYLDLRRELLEAGSADDAFRGHSDTEVLLEAISRWGVEAAIRKTVGMFAFAVWDRRERTLTLGRDRFGEKPLYYGFAGESLVFGSELAALKAHPRFMAEIDREAIALLLRHKYIPAPHCIYRGVHKLPPGTLLTVDTAAIAGRSLPAPRPYWTLEETAGAAMSHPFMGSIDEAKAELDRRLRATIRDQMLADVPLGAFLSGGVDSSAVVALMQAESTRPVNTFTIGFTEAGYNEAPAAKRVAEHLGTNHTELYVTPGQAMDLIPSLPRRYDEPFADSSQIPTVLISQLARKHVTVSLTGDGGDEVFAGYNRYLSGHAMWARGARLPTPIRRSVAAGMESIPPAWWQRATRAYPLLPKRLRITEPADKAGKLARTLAAGRDPGRYYQALVSDWTHPESLVLGLQAPNGVNPLWPEIADPRRAMMYLDMLTYLPGDILQKVDRASMSVSLETRAPYLDHRVVAFAWSLPMDMLVQGGIGKNLLRQALYDYVPRRIVERPKAGFGIPLADWLRRPLRGWADDLLAEDTMHAQGYLDPAPIQVAWREHRDGVRNWSHRLWNVLMFQAWLAEA